MKLGVYQALNIVGRNCPVKNVGILKYSFWFRCLWNGNVAFLDAPAYHQLSHWPAIPVIWK